MPANKYRSAFAAISPQSARTVLRITVLMMVLLAAVSLSPLACGFADKPSRGAGDVDLYRAEIQRIAAGESYYQAASKELHQRGYPTRSVFNWRTPLPMWLLGKLPSEMLGRLIIGALAVAALVVVGFRAGPGSKCTSGVFGRADIDRRPDALLVGTNLRDARGLGRRADFAFHLRVCDRSARLGRNLRFGGAVRTRTRRAVFARLLVLGAARAAVARSYRLAHRIGNIWGVLLVACPSSDAAGRSERSCACRRLAAVRRRGIRDLDRANECLSCCSCRNG